MKRISIQQQLFDEIILYKDPDCKPEYFIEVMKLHKKFDELTNSTNTMKAMTKGSNDRFKKLQEQIKQSCWDEFKIINGKVQTILMFKDREH
eukprot:m51a1_g14514 hypothetical protein (92) ;mRNA; f:837290-837925